MASIDLKKVLSDYTARATPEIVEIPERQYLMVDGTGDPNTADDYRHAIEALYPIAYGLRAAHKKVTGDAYVVMPLEALWWADDMDDLISANKSKWSWTAMIGLPDAMAAEMIDNTVPEVIAKKRLVAGGRVRVERFAEGTTAQVLHVGPYDDEGPVITALHEFIADQGYRLHGTHHEIYLSDPRKAHPSKLRTIIRQPARRRGTD